MASVRELKTMVAAASLPQGENGEGEQDDEGAAELEFLQTLAQDLFSARCKDNNEKPSRTEAIQFRDHFLQHCTPACVRLRGQRLGQNSCASILKALKQHPHVQILDLHGNLVRDSGVFSVSGVIEFVPSITRLDIGANDIRHDGVKHLAATLEANEALEHLELGSQGEKAEATANKINAQGASELFKVLRRHPSLTYLGMNHNVIGTKPQAMEACQRLVKRNKSLAHLMLGFNSLGTASVATLAAAVAPSTSLCTLDLRGSNLNHEAGDALGNMLRTNASLTVLHLSYNALGGKGCLSICDALQSNTSLIVLNMEQNVLEDEGAMALAALLQVSYTLTSLNVAHNAIAEAGGLAIATALHLNSTLASLCLAGNPVRDEATVALAQALATNVALTSLDLHKTKVSDRGVQAIASALSSNSSLSKLLLHDNLIAEAGGMALVEVAKVNKHITAVAINGNQVDHNKVTTLQKLCKKNRTAQRKQEPQRMKKELYRLMYQEDKLERTKILLEQELQRKEEAENEVVQLKSALIALKAEENKMLEDIAEKMKQQEEALHDLAHKEAEKQKQLEQMHIDFDKKFNDLQVQMSKEKADKEAAEAKVALLQEEVENIAQGQGVQVLELKRDIEGNQQKTEKITAYVQKRKTEFEQLKREVELYMKATYKDNKGSKEKDTPTEPAPVVPRPPLSPKGRGTPPAKTNLARKASNASSANSGSRRQSISSNIDQPGSSTRAQMLQGTTLQIGSPAAPAGGGSGRSSASNKSRKSSRR